MATLIACANGNLTSASTWALVNATALLNSQSNTTAISTTILRSSTFTPGAITIDGIAVKLAARASSPTGTFTVRIDQGTTAVTGTTVTVNVSDLPLCTTTNLEGGWQFFKFASPVTLLAATAYSVAVVCSNTGSQVTLHRDATANNFSRMLRTTTTQAPVAGDDMVIAEEKTGAGAATALSVTMNETATTDYGNNSTSSTGLITPALAITQGGSLVFGTSASTAYILRLSGNLIVFRGGTLKIGESGAEIPRTSTAWLEFDCPSDGAFGLTIRNGGTFRHHGLSRTSGKDIWYCKLNTDEAIASTSLGVDTDTGWLDNDVVAVASTTSNDAHCERGTLNGNAGASSLTVDGFAGAGGGLAFAHSGTGDVRAEIILLTRNTGIRAVNSSFRSFIYVLSSAVYSLSWSEYYYLTLSSPGGGGAFEIASTVAGTVTAISVHNTGGIGFLVSGNNVTVDGFAGFGNGVNHFGVDPTAGSNVTAQNLICLLNGGTNNGVEFNGPGGTYTNIVSIGSLNGINITGVGDYDTLECRACGNGIELGTRDYSTSTFANLTVRRNSLTGIASGAYSGTLFIDTIVAIGNGIGGTDANIAGSMRAKNVTCSGEPGYASHNGIIADTNGDIIIDNGWFGALAAHTEATVQVNTGVRAHVILNNVDVADSVEVSNQSLWSPDALVAFTRKNQTDGATSSYSREGKRELDAAVYDTAAPSEKLTPRLASEKMRSGPRLVAANQGDTPTVSVRVRKNASYAGAQPRLMARANAAIGIDVDTVLATMSAGLSAWETLSAVLPAAIDDGAYQVYVDCDGTAGAVNVDNWTPP